MSAEQKLSPGPWRRVGFGALYLIKGDEPRDIAVVQPMSDIPGRALANAALIAAAPELYEACRIALEWWISDYPNDTVEGAEARGKIVAALAKADGER